ncbi:FecCD family ABC transporter permease [Actinobacillus delphinicola]|uniref:FecCD family ABC transporter permease n=1 Tax=Actinobacillus delphinicola TaxID=51161 RepID=UPI002442B4B4|nr:iron ABC transporter permease [Actinobacillus delphinicola]
MKNHLVFSKSQNFLRKSWRQIVPPALLIGCVLTACCIGQYPISLHDLWQNLFFPSTSSNSIIHTVLWQVRLPRILTAILAGAALSMAGATYQGMFKNPLVSPDILGVSAGAGLGAVAIIFVGGSLWQLQLSAFIGGLVAVAIVYAIAKIARYHAPILALVLAGIALAALLKAGISILKIFAEPYSQLTTMTFWLLGALNMATFHDLAFMVPLILLAVLPLILLRWRMNLLSLEDEEAQSLGLNLSRTRLIFIVSATLMTSTIIAVTGIIGWIGLIVPHVARLWLGEKGSDFRQLLPVTIFFGSAILLIADTFSRATFSVEIPLGIITAIVGVPFFLGLLILGGRK